MLFAGARRQCGPRGRDVELGCWRRARREWCRVGGTLVSGGLGQRSRRWQPTLDRRRTVASGDRDGGNGRGRPQWCREKGLYPAELDVKKQDAFAGLDEPRAASAERTGGDQGIGATTTPPGQGAGRRIQRGVPAAIPFSSGIATPLKATTALAMLSVGIKPSCSRPRGAMTRPLPKRCFAL
jgi:hypothetical protein